MRKLIPYAAVVKTPRFVGIKVAAEKLGCNENHLRMVLKGTRASKVLTAKVKARFPALLGGAGK